MTLWPPTTFRRAALVIGAALLVAVGTILRTSPSADAFTVAAVRTRLTVTLTETGTLRPAEALTYRSRVAGREIEIMWLAPEGKRVARGDALIRLDTSDLEIDLERATQAMRQAQLDAGVAEAEAQAANSALKSLSSGKETLDVEEARLNLRLAEVKAEQLKKDHESLAPLLNQGYVTREELERVALEAEQAAGAVGLARRRVTVLSEQTIPREQQRATLDVAHRTSQIEVARQRARDAAQQVQRLQKSIDDCTIVAEHPGLVVYEENMSSNPRRKVRAGDRVTPSQGVLTIPEVSRMLADTSLREADLHRVTPGQRASIALEAYPEARLTGRVVSVGTVARLAPERPYEGKRFDVVIDIDPSLVDLRPEMTAHIEVWLAEVANALVVPVNTVFERGGKQFVRVAGDRGLEDRMVTLGAANDVHVQILHGLSAGERVRMLDGTEEAMASPDAAGRPATTSAPTTR